MYRFRVEAPVEAIYAVGFAPDKWFTFFRGYRGLESVDPNWPKQDSSIVIRLGFGPWTVKVKQSIVAHERGRRLRIHEETRPSLWTDDVEFRFDPENGATNVTVINNVRVNFLLLRLLVFLLRTLVGERWAEQGFKRFKAMIEGSKTS